MRRKIWLCALAWVGVSACKKSDEAPAAQTEEKQVVNKDAPPKDAAEIAALKAKIAQFAPAELTTDVSTLTELSQEIQCELMLYVTYFTQLLGELLRPDGFNVGLNLGRDAGSGIDSHLHMHLVPRWNGDSNFMPVVGNTRILPETLEDTYDKIVAGIQSNPPVFR